MWSLIGTTSIARVRQPVCSSKAVLCRYGAPGRHRVGVVEVHRLAVPGDVAGEARVVDRHRPLGEGEPHGVVLRELEAEPLAVRPLLEEVEAPRFRPREPAGLGEDLLEEPVEVPLGGEGDADPVQGGDALLGLGEPPGESRGRRARVEATCRGGRENRGEDGGRSVAGKGEAPAAGAPARRPSRRGRRGRPPGGGARGRRGSVGRREIERGSVAGRGRLRRPRPVVEPGRAHGLGESVRQRLRRTVEDDALRSCPDSVGRAPAGSTRTS